MHTYGIIKSACRKGRVCAFLRHAATSVGARMLANDLIRSEWALDGSLLATTGQTSNVYKRAKCTDIQRCLQPQHATKFGKATKKCGRNLHTPVYSINVCILNGADKTRVKCCSFEYECQVSSIAHCPAHETLLRFVQITVYLNCTCLFKLRLNFIYSSYI